MNISSLIGKPLPEGWEAMKNEELMDLYLACDLTDEQERQILARMKTVFPKS